MMFKARSGLKASLVLVSLLISAPAPAALIQVFEDHDVFVSATGATSATGPIPNLGKVADAGVPKVQGSVMFTVVSPSIDMWFGKGGGVDWTPLLPGNEIAIGERENLDAQFAGPVFAAGFEFAEPTCTSGCAASTFAITLRDAASGIVGSFLFAPKQDVAQFFGVWSDTAFNLMQIRETLPLDSSNEYFGQFYTSTTAVPEPSALVILSIALLLTGALLHRRPAPRVLHGC
jgi:hypothetical protein